MRSTRWINTQLITDATADDSDKTFTVPAASLWIPLAISTRLVTTATVGNRLLDILLTDASDNVLLRFFAGAVQAASLTRDYYFAPGHPQEITFTNNAMLRVLPTGIALPEGYKIRVYDSAAIAAAADDLTVRLFLEVLRA